MSNGKPVDQVLRGTAVSSGISIGRVYLLERGKIHVTKYAVKDEQVDKEVSRLKDAVGSAVEELNAVLVALENGNGAKPSPLNKDAQ